MLKTFLKSFIKKYRITPLKLFSEKGFLGPIGDDLPSLIPLLFALMIFFSTFTFAMNEFNAKNADINTKLEILRVARVLRTNGYIGSYNDFKQMCDSIPLTAFKFKAGLIDLSAQQAAGAQPTPLSVDLEEDFIKDPKSSSRFICMSKKTEFKESVGLSEGRIYSLIYPIALEYNNVVLPVHLVVVAWKT